MKLIIEPASFRKQLLRLIERYEKYYIAVAWASVGTDVFDALLNNRVQIKKAIIGTHFYQTHPNFIKQFIDSNRVRFIFQPEGIFHPKVYLFSNNREDWECLVGSANLTRAAMTNNSEIISHISSNDRGAKITYRKLIARIDEYWKNADKAKTNDYLAYKELWKRQQTRVNKLSGKYGQGQSRKSPVKTHFFTMGWSEYVSLVKADEHHGLKKRLKLLDRAKQIFENNVHFSGIGLEERKGLAGIASEDQFPWGWFGSMKGAGVFKNRIIENDPNISIALDQIPMRGAVTRDHYDQYVIDFIRAFPKGRHGVAVASRLLAMKRPDTFVCLDNRNRDGLCEEFGIKKSKMTYERYWEEIIERMFDSVWWSSPEPKNRLESRIWAGRAAMLDAIFFVPRA